MITAQLPAKPAAILFLGLARNCERTLPAFFSYLDRLEYAGFNCRALIGENGSWDRTRSLIERARRVEVIDTGLMSKGANRLARMALGRQVLLDAALRSKSEVDYIGVLDLDEAVLQPPEPVAVACAIQHLQVDPYLFAVGATSLPVYYDLLSLRCSGHDYSDLYTDISRAKRRPLSYFQFHQQRIYNNQILIPHANPIFCLSSFNGFCLYNSDDYFRGSYRAENETKVCEHVNFNLSVAIATDKRMVIAPEVVIRAPSAHIPVNFSRFWADRIREKLVETVIAPVQQRHSAQNSGVVNRMYKHLLQSALPGPSRSDEAVS